jgi:exopolyphosphatase/guanosine-5'-triphosphate,3'-diphosphate pyrophosphatase
VHLEPGAPQPSNPLRVTMAEPELEKPLRLGLVDMGSNAIRVQIVEAWGPGREPRILENHRAPVRLGDDVFLTGSIPATTIDAAVEVMRRFRESCDRYGVAYISAIATAATREASNQAELLDRVRDATGVQLEVITGAQEAYLLKRAVESRLRVRDGRLLLVDVGGGSVEVTLLEHGEIVAADSFRLGAVRLLRALTAGHREEQQGNPFLELLDEYVGSVEARIQDLFGGKLDHFVATGGNIETIADLLAREGKLQSELGVDACRLEDVSDLTRRLAGLPYAARMSQFELRPDRADTILPAAVVYYRFGCAAKVQQVIVPRVGIRDGLREDAIAGLIGMTRTADRRAALMAACRAIGRRYHVDENHAESVRRLAAQLFAATRPLHRLEDEDGTLLEAAALLHDIGSFVSYGRHHKHSAYLIRSSDIVGLDRAQREVVAWICRYHRRAHPHPKHYGWLDVKSDARQRITKLAALLRVADSLDRAHRGKLVDLEITLDADRVGIRPRLRDGIRSDLVLEKQGVAEKGQLFADAFGVPIRLDA